MLLNPPRLRMPCLCLLAQAVFDVSSHGEMMNNANAMCVIPADDAAKEDLEGSAKQRG
jgi:hypothetical protein